MKNQETDMKDAPPRFTYKEFGLKKPGDLINLFKKFPNKIFIETGTYHGKTLFSLLDSNFTTLKSVELSGTMQAINRLASEWLSKNTTDVFSSLSNKTENFLWVIKQCLKSILRGNFRLIPFFFRSIPFFLRQPPLPPNLRKESINHYNDIFARIRQIYPFLGNKKLPRIELYEGLSHKMLPAMLKEVKESAVIFLDAHPSGKDTAMYKEIKESKYSLSNIISEEIKVILQHEIKNHIIIVDDADKNYGNSQIIPLFEKANLLDHYHFFHGREFILENPPADTDRLSIGRDDKLLFCIPMQHDCMSMIQAI